MGLDSPGFGAWTLGCKRLWQPNHWRTTFIKC